MPMNLLRGAAIALLYVIAAPLAIIGSVLQLMGLVVSARAEAMKICSQGPTGANSRRVRA